MKIVFVILGVIALAVVGVLGFASTRPAEFRLERKGTMPAPADIVFAQINDFHAWEDWSPWAKLDPTMKTEYAGAPSGPGATYAWNGNDKVGSGKMTMTETVPGKSLTLKLEFLTPIEATNMTTFALTPVGASTEVVWSMTGNNNLMAKVAGLFMNMDALVGADFERGLANLSKKTAAVYGEQKAAAEAAAAHAAETAGADAGTATP